MQTIRVEEQDDVTYVWLNRPNVRNAMNEVLMQEVTNVVQALQKRTRALVFAGEGEMFCSGGDLNWMKRSIGFTYEQNLEDVHGLMHMLKCIDEAPCVTLARVHGAAMGGALGFLAACDIVLAEPQTQFAFTEVRLGLVPAVISPFVLNKISVSSARRYFLTAERFDAKAAQNIGLVHEVLTLEEIETKIQQLLKQIRQVGPIAVKEVKQLLKTIVDHNRDESFRYAQETLARLRITQEGQEGVSAFLEKRSPHW